MRQDDHPSSRSLDATRPAMPIAPGLRSVSLAFLVGVTSLAVGATTSYWLVPLYLLTMGWLLLGPSAGAASGSPVDRPVEGSISRPDLEPAGASRSGPETISESPQDAPGSRIDEPAKPRGKARSRGGRGRAKAQAESPTTPPTIATWVQVAPGKFVRVEVPTTSTTEFGESQVAPGDVEPEKPSVPPAVVESDGPTVHGLADETEGIVGEAELAATATAEAAGPSDPGPDDVSTEEPSSGSQQPSSSELVDDIECTPHDSAAGRPGIDDYGPKEAVTFDRGVCGFVASQEMAPGLADEIPHAPPNGPASEAGDELGVPLDDEPPPMVATNVARHGPPIRRVDSGVLRSARLRRDPRPRPRRANGRVGATPRVICKRA